LWRTVSKGPQSILNTADWIDRPSVGIPYLYVATGMELAEAFKTRGNDAAAASVFDLSKRIATAVRLQDLIRPAEAEFAQPLTGDSARSTQMPTVQAPAVAPPVAAPQSAPPPKPKSKGKAKAP
jgi:hypothetical protein